MYKFNHPALSVFWGSLRGDNVEGLSTNAEDSPVYIWGNKHSLVYILCHYIYLLLVPISLLFFPQNKNTYIPLEIPPFRDVHVNFSVNILPDGHEMKI